MSSSDPAEPDRNITAFFDTRDAAEAAIGKMGEAGVPRDKILLRAGAARKAGIVEDKKSLIQEVKDLVLPSESPDASVEALRHEGFLVTVRPDAESHDEILGMLEQHNGLGVESREDIWPEWKSDPGQNPAEAAIDDEFGESSAAPHDDTAAGSEEPQNVTAPDAAEATGRAEPRPQIRTDAAAPPAEPVSPPPT